MIRKILGPPGTGKTTKLLKYVQTFLKLGTPIEKIGYFALLVKRMKFLALEKRNKTIPRNNYKTIYLNINCLLLSLLTMLNFSYLK